MEIKGGAVILDKNDLTEMLSQIVRKYEFHNNNKRPKVIVFPPVELLTFKSLANPEPGEVLIAYCRMKDDQQGPEEIVHTIRVGERKIIEECINAGTVNITPEFAPDVPISCLPSPEPKKEMTPAQRKARAKKGGLAKAEKTRQKKSEGKAL